MAEQSEPVSATNTEGLEAAAVEEYASGEMGLLGIVAAAVAADLAAGAAAQATGVGMLRRRAAAFVRGLTRRGVAAAGEALSAAAEAGRAAARRSLRRRGAPTTSADAPPVPAEPAEADLIEPDIPASRDRTAEKILADLRRTAPRTPRTARGVTIRTPAALLPQLEAMSPHMIAAAEGLYQQVMTQVLASPVESDAARQRLAQKLLDQAAAKGLTGFVDAGGRRWSMVSYVEMATRTAAAQSAIDAHCALIAEHGYDLVRVSVHENCSPMCAPFQGHLLSVTGATTNVGPEPWRERVITSLADARLRGFNHPNCKHSVAIWVPGDPLPEAPEVDPEDYKATQRLRELERNIRAQKRVLAVAMSPEAEAAARVRIRALQAQVRELVAETGIPRQRHREQIDLGYNTSAPKWPEILGLNAPSYRDFGDDGIARSLNFIGEDGIGEPLPDLGHMPGHVIYGWRDDDEVHSLGDRRGHRWDSQRHRATVFPESWTDQQIVDAIRETIESPTHEIPPRPGVPRRVVRSELNDVVVEAMWEYREGRAYGLTGYPVRGDGVQEVGPGGEPGPVQRPNRNDKRFREVER